MPRILTADKLREVKVCKKQIDLFVELFGEQVEVTPELCEKHALDFDFYFAANYLCNKEEFYSFLYIYSIAFEKYDNITDDAWKKYYTKKQYTRDEYFDIKKRAKVERMKTIARTFAVIYNSEA